MWAGHLPVLTQSLVLLQSLPGQLHLAALGVVLAGDGQQPLLLQEEGGGDACLKAPSPPPVS